MDGDSMAPTQLFPLRPGGLRPPHAGGGGAQTIQVPRSQAQALSLTSIDSSLLWNGARAAVWMVPTPAGRQGAHARPPTTRAAAAHASSCAFSDTLGERDIFAVSGKVRNTAL